MRVETLNLNFSIKDGLTIVSKTKMKNCWSMIDHSPGDIKMLGLCPAGQVLPHGEKVPL